MDKKTTIRENFWGEEYAEHEDENGKTTGRSREREDWLGNKYVEHEDAHGKTTGRSREREDWFGNKYVEHEDVHGKTTGRSREKEDIFGNKYVEHEDENGRVIGRSEVREDMFGNQYVKTEEIDPYIETEEIDPDDNSALSVLLTFLGVVFLGVLKILWKLIKTMPFWLPYASIFLLVFLMMPASTTGMAGTSAGGEAAGVLFFVYLILHTVLLLKCKRWDAPHKYWPVSCACFLLIIGMILVAATNALLAVAPAVGFQIGVLIYMGKKKRSAGGHTGQEPAPDTNPSRYCTGCGAQVAEGANFCGKCGKPVK